VNQYIGAETRWIWGSSRHGRLENHVPGRPTDENFPPAIFVLVRFTLKKGATEEEGKYLG